MKNSWGHELIFPEGILYSPELLWVRIESGNKLRLGLSHLAVRSVKRLLAMDIVCGKGTQLKKGDKIGSVETTKARWEIISPISGEVLEVNPLIYGHTATVTIMKDAYGEGWLVDLKKVSETEGELQKLYKGETPETKEWILAQIRAFVPLADAEDYGD
jgi:glycine cleavage system H protein